MTIELDKILTDNSENWCKSEKKSLEDYDQIGVTKPGVITSSTNLIGDKEMQKLAPKRQLAKIVPENAEIVVSYKVALSASITLKNDVHIFYEANATALIPKKKDNYEKDIGKDD